MTLTPDEREAAIEKMARAIAGCQVELGADKWRYCLPEARAALDAVLPLIERAVLLRAAAAIAKANEKVGHERHRPRSGLRVYRMRYYATGCDWHGGGSLVMDRTFNRVLTFLGALIVLLMVLYVSYDDRPIPTCYFHGEVR